MKKMSSQEIRETWLRFFESKGHSVEPSASLVPFDDPTYNEYQELSELPKHVADEMGHFFTVYKSLEAKETVVNDTMDAASAREIIDKCRENYIEKYCK